MPLSWLCSPAGTHHSHPPIPQFQAVQLTSSIGQHAHRSEPSTFFRVLRLKGRVRCGRGRHRLLPPHHHSHPSSSLAQPTSSMGWPETRKPLSWDHLAQIEGPQQQLGDHPGVGARAFAHPRILAQTEAASTKNVTFIANPIWLDFPKQYLFKTL